jgi:hypothetical protein
MHELAGIKLTTDGDVEAAREKLDLVNLSVRRRGDGPSGQPDGGPYLAIPNEAPQLAKLFAGTEWQGQWSDALKQGIAMQVVVSDRSKGQVRINGSPKRCLLIDWAAFQKHAGAEQ